MAEVQSPPRSFEDYDMTKRHQTDLFYQMLEEEGLRELPDGDLIDERYYDLVLRMKSMCRYLSIPCKFENVAKLIPKWELNETLATFRLLIAKACTVHGAQADAALITVAKKLENLIAQATGKRSPQRSIEILHAEILQAA